MAIASATGIGTCLARVVALALLGFALASCAPLPSRSVIPSRDDIARQKHVLPDPPSVTSFASGNDTPARRLDTVAKIWRTIEDDYYDPTFNGIDVAALQARSQRDAVAAANDAEFYRVLKRDVGSLHDSHTTILTPRQAVQSRGQRATQIGIVLELVEGRVVISEVVPGFPAAEAGVRSGTIVDAIDGTPMDAAFVASSSRPAPADAASDATEPDEGKPVGDDADRARRNVTGAVRALLVERDGLPRVHRLGLRRADDSTFEVDVQARVGDVPTVERFEVLPSGIGVLRLSRFDGTKRRELARDLDLARVQTRGLILDLRENPGGEVRVFRWLVGRFLEQDLSVGTMTVRENRRAVTVQIPGESSADPYTAPLAILTDRSTASAAEWAAYALVELRGAVTVGDRTCGCVVGVRREFLLPDGGVLRLAEVGFHSAQDRRMEGEPLPPTFAIRPTLAQLRAGTDAPLRAAERALLAGLAGLDSVHANDAAR